MVDKEEAQALEDAKKGLLEADGSGEEKEAAKKLLRIASQHDAATRQEAVEAVSGNTQYTKETAKEMMKEQAVKAPRDGWSVEKIGEVKPDAEGMELYDYIFQISAGGETKGVCLSTNDLNSPHTLRDHVFNLTGERPTWEDWNLWLEELWERVPIETFEEEPHSPEHRVEESILDQLQTIDVVTDRSEFNEHPYGAAFYQPDGDSGCRELWVSARLIDDQTQGINQEVSLSKVAKQMDWVLAGRSKRVGTDRRRVWRFDVDVLLKYEMIEEPA